MIDEVVPAPALDDEDGEPIWSFAEGASMPGSFRAWERLGVGIRCETWLVWSPRLWGPAVLKLPRPHQVGNPRSTRSLAREVAALSDNPHPVLPRLYEDGIGEEIPYVATEYVDGPTLADEIDETGPLGAEDVALLGIQVLAGLRTLHQHGVAHVDVKPENIVLRDGRPILIDFGSAREIGARQPTGRPVGTQGYAPPEMEACEPITPGMDVYALGMTLREALTGSLHGALPKDGLGEVIARLCEPDPARRPTTEGALALLGVTLDEDVRPWPGWVRPYSGR
ncbi:serine/threonine-protein kinase [Actinoplanes sp. NPDC051470]|uniref:serine/threonine protein kinase n=1 Tax=unclassified Actinoplanes TaxID=2626549 RepID=UPI00343386E0